MKKYKFIFYFILMASTSCKSQVNQHLASKKIKSEADLLNDKALKTSGATCNKDSLEKAIKLFERAIKLDNTVPLFYSNEAEIFCSLKKYKDAIKVLNRFLYYFPVNLSMEVFKGYIYEKTGDIDSAEICYSDAMSHYNMEIQENPNNISIQLNRALLLYFTQGNSQAIVEYNRISKKFPNSESVKFLREDFYSFDRKSYINQLFPNCNGSVF